MPACHCGAVAPPDPDADRRRTYLIMMAAAVGLFVLAWSVVRLVSVPAAIAMSMVAAGIPPLAAILGNRR